MHLRVLTMIVAIALLVSAISPVSALATSAAPVFTLRATYTTGLGSLSGETVAFGRNRMYVTNSVGNSLDIVDLSNIDAPSRITRIDLSPYGAGPNSVAARGNLVAVAVEADPKTDPGSVVFFNPDGRYLNHVRVGALPDMLTFSPNGRLLLVANEGEPNDTYTIDPYGTISIIPVSGNIRRLRDHDVIHIGFSEFEVGGAYRDQFDPATRIFGPTANDPDAVQKNLEPEYITVTADNQFAYVTLQENNAIAKIDLRFFCVEWVRSLGLKDHSIAGHGLDASDRDSAINITTWPVFGMYQPDAIATYKVRGQTYLVTANEGDAREYSGFNEEIRVGSSRYQLDPTVFPNATSLKVNAALGRLTVSNASGDIDGDGDFDQIHVFGGRSFSIWDAEGRLVFDSGDQIEQIVATTYPTFFNSNNDENNFDSRSDNKGPEPEGLAIGRIGQRAYAFVGLERQGGVMIFDISTPNAPVFVQYINNRDFGGASVGPDSGPEIVTFVPANRSPSGRALVLVANEVSGTVSVYEADR
ncbi:choice-of-anchor I family protein [Chloroflexus sp.]|uniref:choice-of-anchor I family protein n=1 Tax=Chloroflexus sp. TaxID=1904827 RepID=UPI002610AFF7|nr:choice-of-anchor I family protein [uncultured Chloroflexus sp.]